MAFEKMPGENIKKFIRDSGAEEELNKLKAKFPNGIIVSDVIDDSGNQYVDLVQEGGGVWGVALVGYTYIMEEMGIRFFSLAGTSAGAINTMMLAVTGNANEQKYDSILSHLIQLDLDKLVDGQGDTKYTKFVRWLVKKILIKKNFIKKVINMLHWMLALFITLSAGSFIGNFLIHHPVSRWLGLTPLLLMIFLFGLLWYGKSKLKDFLAKGIGLNEGKFFHRWINEKVADHTIGNMDTKDPIKNLVDFHKHFSRETNLKIRSTRKGNDAAPTGESRMISIITCDITSKNKIQFPRMWDLYWKDKADVRPGDLVRASMSIPGFFKMFNVKVQDSKSKAKKDAWEKHLNWNNDVIPEEVNFVDGGAISNFPLNVFFNPNYSIPRMPTFGVRLNNGNDKDEIAKANTVGEYANSMLSSIRGYYDKDFIRRNPSFAKGICSVNLEGHSSVNFFMKPRERETLFLAGAKAAVAFLEEFEWEKYKDERAKDISRFDYIIDPNNLKGSDEKARAVEKEVEKIKDENVKTVIKKQYRKS